MQENMFNLCHIITSRSKMVLIILVVFAAPSTLADGVTAKKEYPWLDDLHNQVTGGVNATAQWFDNFFALEGAKKSIAHGSIRVRLGWEPRSRSINDFSQRFRLRMKLPKLKDRWELVIGDYSDQENRQEIQAARTQLEPEQDNVSVAVSWLKETGKGSWKSRVGVGRGAQAFIKGAYQRIFTFSTSNKLKLEPSFYYYSSDGLGSRLDSDWTYTVNSEKLWRNQNSLIYRHDEGDWIWQQGIYRYRQIRSNLAVISGLFMEGRSEPNWRVDEYLLSTKVRTQALREWMFFEVEPFLLWKRDEDFKASIGVAFRVEMKFGR